MQNQITDGFIRLLMADTLLGKKNFDRLLIEAKREQISFVSYLIKENVINPPCLLQKRLAKELSLSFIDLDKIDPFCLPIHLIDKKLLQKYQVVPLWLTNQKLSLALADPTQQAAIDDIRFYTGLSIEKILVDPQKLENLLKKINPKQNFKQNKSYKSRLTCLKHQASLEHPYMKEYSRESISLKGENIDDDATIIRTVYRILQSAIKYGASDVHLEPYQNQLQIRFRIDGLLYLARTFSKSLTQRIITRLKIMSELDIAERRIPQDGRFQITDANQKIDCRISTCPTLYGEKLVIRILDNNKILLAIDNLGMNKSQKICFLKALRYPHGMVLVTGPTGSGKTITLYTALNFLNTSILNISSVENPVEIVLPGINQVNINPKVGLNMATVLRSFLRQDPDVIMVGEMRDQETAEIGIKAAQTGHLVLSSLHTNSSTESLIRLVNMGIPSYNIASSVNLIIAQRLVRCLCVHCKIKEELPERVLLNLGLNQQEIQSITLFKAGGCGKCTEGYYGRIGIFEMLSITDAIKNLILNDYDARKIAIHAENTGMQNLYSSALEKLKLGKISLKEMKRVVKD